MTEQEIPGTLIMIILPILPLLLRNIEEENLIRPQEHLLWIILEMHLMRTDILQHQWILNPQGEGKDILEIYHLGRKIMVPKGNLVGPITWIHMIKGYYYLGDHQVNVVAIPRTSRLS